jgi:hypothetical protein
VDRRKKAVRRRCARAAQPKLTVNDFQRSPEPHRDILGFHAGEPWMDKFGKMMGIEIKAGAGVLPSARTIPQKGRDRVKGVGTRIYCAMADIDASRHASRHGGARHEPQTQPWASPDSPDH